MFVLNFAGCRFSAWEVGFRKRVQDSRLSELRMLFKFLMASAMFGVLWEGLGYVMTMAAFTAYSYQVRHRPDRIRVIDRFSVFWMPSSVPPVSLVFDSAALPLNMCCQ